jgi:ABC-2 type transport system permease protein
MNALSRICVVTRKDIVDLLSGKFYLYVILMGLICIPYFTGAKDMLVALTGQGASALELRSSAQSYVNVMAYTLPMMLAMLTCSIFSSYAILVDKTKRVFETLLATPLSLRQVWLGKTFGVVIPGLAVGLFLSLAAILAVDLALLKPATGFVVFPSIVPLATALVISPVLVLLVVSLISLLQMIMANPRVPSFAFSAVFFAIYATTIIMKVSGSWSFGVIYSGAALIVGVSLLFLTRMLTKERTVLSSKG